MKLRHSLSIFGLVAMLGLGVGVGLASGQKPVAKAKADAGTFYYHGTDVTTDEPVHTGKVSVSWQGSSTHYFEDGVTNPSNGWTFVPGEQFKITNGSGATWGTEYNARIAGTAVALFSGGYDGESNSNISYNGQVDATFDVTLDAGYIYFDYQDDAVFYYVGNDKTKAGSEWTNYTDKPILVNGSAVNMTLNAEEEFKLRPSVDHSDWRASIGAGSLKSSYYKIFTGSNNIYVHYGFSYDISLVSANHTLKINIVAHNPETNTVYVLDLYGDLLNVKHNAHYFNNAYSIETDWPGVEMGVVPTTSNVYSVTYWDAFDKVIFNQIGDGDKTGQTIDLTLTGNEGKCLILNHDVNGQYKWNSNTWLSLDAAKFIDGYMKFNEYDENTYNDEETGVTANCDANWTAAKTAYNALASNAVRLEVLSIAVVKTRLGNWAAAHGAILNDSGAAITPRAPVTIANATEQSSTNTTLIIAIVASSVAALALIGGYFYFRKRKEDR